MTEKTKLIHDLQLMANTIRTDIITTARDCAEGVHAGGSLSLAEALSVLFFSVLNVDPKNPKNPERDRLILSKGSCQYWPVISHGTQRFLLGG